MRRQDRRGQNQGGYVLISTLSVLLIVSGLVASASLYARSVLQSVSLAGEAPAMQGRLDGGLEVAAYQLFVLKLPVKSVDGRRIRFGGGMVTPQIDDEAGKIDVNTGNLAVLEGLLQTSGMDRARVGRIMARLTERRAVAPPAVVAAAPSTADLQQPAAPTTGTKQTGFRSVDDFASFVGLDPSETKALLPSLTIYNSDGKVNVATASRKVIMALPAMSASAADDLIARRSHLDLSDRADADRLMMGLTDQKSYVKGTDGPIYRLRVDAVSADGHRKSVTSIVGRSVSPEAPYFIFEAEGS